MAAAVVAAKVAKDAATAGPKAGKALGGQGESAADAARQTELVPVKFSRLTRRGILLA